MASNSAVCTQLHIPTGVTHSVCAHLTHPQDASSLPNLVLARSTVLEVHVVRQTSASEARLELVARCRLFAVVESLAVLKGRAGRAGLDACLLTFRDAKLSVLHWDAERHELAPTSLHYFEGDESLKGGRAVFPRPPLVVSDPAGRCAAVLMFRHQLGVLPAMESDAAALGFALDDLYGGGSSGGGAAATATATVGNSYVDNLSKMGIREVRDAAFLHGYNEPVLLVLHEADPTWAGNLRSKKDTCCLSALSLNLTAKRHPRIWHATGLPSDAYRLLPAPCGGAVVLCLNTILYYTQGHHTGVVINTAALPSPVPPPPLQFDMSREPPAETAAKYAHQHATELHPDTAAAALAFCDASLAGWNLECDAAHAAWVGPSTALLGLKSGQLLLVEVTRLGGGKATLRLAKAGASPPASCMAALSPSLLFVGSLAGDSLLVGCTLGAAAAARQTSAGAAGGQPDAKRQRLQSADADQTRAASEATGNDAAAEAQGQADGGGGGGGGEDSDEEAWLYGSALGEAGGGGPPGLQCWLQVLDSLVGIGPVRSLAAGAVGDEPPYLLACCGQEKSGALCVLRQSVAPDILTQVPLPGVLGAWAVRHRQPFPDEGSSFHSYLLLSFPGSTKVLATGAELREVTEEAEFAVDTTTISAGEVCGGRRLVQAFPQGVRLLEGAEQRQDVLIDALTEGAETGSSGAAVALHAVHIADPFVLAQLSDGTVRLLQADPSTHQLRLAATAPQAWGSAGRRVAACCLFVDECGWLGRQLWGSAGLPQSQGPSGSENGASSTAAAAGEAAAAQPAVYSVMCYADGAVAIWTLPDPGPAPVWRCEALAAGGKLLVPVPVADAAGPASLAAAGGLPGITEIRMESFGRAAALRPELAASLGAVPLCEAPVLVALTSENTLLAYKSFACSAASDVPGQRSVRFARLSPALPALLPPAAAPPGSPALPRLARFDALGEQIPHSGVFVAGAHPQWLVAARGALHPHPHHLPPGLTVTGFTTFNNANCPHGFITVCCGTRSAIHISQLPLRQRLDAPWPRQKISIKATPIKACLYAEAGLFAVITSRPAPPRPYLPEEEGGEPQASYAYALADARDAARGAADLHEVRLLQPGGWATLWRHALLPGEQALAVEAVRVRDTTTQSTVPLVAVGTGFAAGEDYPCSGRVILFEVTREGSGGGDPGWGARLVYAREFKGPVTAVAAVEGYLLLATGNRLETCMLTSHSVVHSSEEGGGVHTTTTYKVQRSAFYDGPSLVTALCVVKNFVLMGDAQHSVQFVQYRDQGRQLALLSKDFGAAAVAAAQFLIAGSSLHVVAADGAGNLRTYTYAPKDAGSWKGQKLLPWGAMHVGDRVTAMARLRMPPPRPDDATPRQAVLFGTDAGGLGVLAPLALAAPLAHQAPRGDADAGAAAAAGDSLAALRAVQQALVAGVSHAAGLNPAAFRRRYARTPLSMEGGNAYGKPLELWSQGILDGDVLLSFQHLPRAAQVAVAARAGVGREELLRVLSDLVRTAVLF